MSLASSRNTVKNALLNLANNVDSEKTKEAAIDEFLDALEDWIKSASVRVNGTGLTSPSGAVTGFTTDVTIE